MDEGTSSLVMLKFGQCLDGIRRGRSKVSETRGVANVNGRPSKAPKYRIGNGIDRILSGASALQIPDDWKSPADPTALNSEASLDPR